MNVLLINKVLNNELKNRFDINLRGITYLDNCTAIYINNISDQLYGMLQFLISVELPFIYVNDMLSENEYLLYRFHGEINSKYNQLSFNQIVLTEREKEIEKYYKLMSNI